MKLTREHEWQADHYRMESSNFDRERANALYERVKVLEMKLADRDATIKTLKETLFRATRKRSLNTDTEVTYAASY
jgi:predicted RNase H-like nuclease (RuvC/YqgF family)